MNTIVRDARIDDMPWLLEELRAFSAFFGTRKPLFPADEDQALATVLRLVDTQPFFVAEINGRPVGFIAGALQPHTFNPEITVLSELFWWVTPEHRQSRAGAALFNRFLDLGRDAADWVVMTLEAGSPVNEATIERRGFRLYERSWLLEVDRSSHHGGFVDATDLTADTTLETV